MRAENPIGMIGYFDGDESPLADAEALSNGDWGCSVVATTEKAVPVTVGLPSTVYCPDSETGTPVEADYDAYYIATTVLTNGLPSWSAEGWRLPQP